MSFCDYSSPQYPCPQANPDISGIGVSIFNSTYLTIINIEKVFVSSLVIGLAATISSFCQAILRNKIKRLKDHHIEGSVVKLYIFWCDVLERIIISLADQQIVTGYALVVTAYSRLPSPLSHRGKQQPAQFALVIYLSGISGITHLTCMSTLGTYLDNHPTLTRIRFALMICFGVWLILSIGFLSASYHDTRSVLGILCLCFLLEYSSTLLKLIPSSRKWMLERTKRYPFISRISKPSLDLTATMAGLSCTFFLAIWQKFIPGCDGRDAYPTHDVAENVWGFGQVLPMVMLLLPMSSGLEVCDPISYVSGGTLTPSLELKDNEKTVKDTNPATAEQSLVAGPASQIHTPQTTNDGEPSPASPGSGTGDQGHADLQSAPSDIELHSMVSHESETQHDESGSAVHTGPSSLHSRTVSTFPEPTSSSSSSQSNAEHLGPPLRRRTAGQMV